MDSYDYIIVGSGSGGGVVATRLAEDPNVSVLVLEAGGTDWNFVFHMGIGFYRNRPAHLNWGFQSEPEPHLNNRRIDLPQGRVLGGSSSINGKVYSRGNPVDYDEWQQLGAEGWAYDDVLPYFKKAEGSWRGDSVSHGASGPLATTAVNPKGTGQEPLLEAAVNCGHKIVEDLDSEPFEGISRSSDITVNKKGRRTSTARTYLRPAMQRGNLTVHTHARVVRILVENGRAVGIEYFRKGKRLRAYADREVILSAGVYNTPRLLLLSGIGPADELRALGIKPVLDLPGVGTNIADHASVMLSFATYEQATPLRELRLDRAAIHFMRWALLGTGPFATQPLSAQGLIRTLPELDRPDAQIFFNPLRRDAQIFVPGITKSQEHRIEAAVVLLHPYSRGTLKLKSSNPDVPPSVQLNLMSDPRDMDTLVRAIKAARDIHRTEPIKSMIKTEVAPGADVDTDEKLQAFIRKTLYTVRHPVGSCRMGNDDLAVVDPQLRVRGIEGLRIVDASVMPRIPGGNTNAPTIMIGEKAADLIKGQEPLPRSL